MLEFDQRPSALARLIYASRAVAGSVSPDMLQSIIATSIQNNRTVDVTGLLVVGSDRFLQVLEGPADRVAEVYARVRKDPRHEDVVLITEGPADKRLFRDWNMAQRRLVADDEAVLASVGLEVFSPGGLDEERALRLVRALGQTHLR